MSILLKREQDMTFTKKSFFNSTKERRKKNKDDRQSHFVSVHQLSPRITALYLESRFETVKLRLRNTIALQCMTKCCNDVVHENVTLRAACIKRKGETDQSTKVSKRKKKILR